MDQYKDKKVELFDAVKAELPADITVSVDNNANFYYAVFAMMTDGRATVDVTINNVSRKADICRLWCRLSAPGISSREFKQAQARSKISPKEIADNITAMLKLSHAVVTAKATMLAQAKAAVLAAAPDAPMQAHADVFSVSLYGDLIVFAVERRGEEVILSVRDRSRSYGSDVLSVTPEQEFDAEKFSQYIGGFVDGKREKYLKVQQYNEAKKLSEDLARQLNDEYPLGCRGTADPNKIVVGLDRSMTADQARKLGEFLKTLE